MCSNVVPFLYETCSPVTFRTVLILKLLTAASARTQSIMLVLRYSCKPFVRATRNEFTVHIYTMPRNRISISDSYDDWCTVIISIVGETQQRSHSYNKQAVRRSTTVTITAWTGLYEWKYRPSKATSYNWVGRNMSAISKQQTRAVFGVIVETYEVSRKRF